MVRALAKKHQQPTFASARLETATRPMPSTAILDDVRGCANALAGSVTTVGPCTDAVVSLQPHSRPRRAARELPDEPALHPVPTRSARCATGCSPAHAESRDPVAATFASPGPTRSVDGQSVPALH